MIKSRHSINESEAQGRGDSWKYPFGSHQQIDDVLNIETG